MLDAVVKTGKYDEKGSDVDLADSDLAEAVSITLTGPRRS
jgi:hypothetical protein